MIPLHFNKQTLKKLIRITTVPISLNKLLGRQLTFMNRHFEVTAVSAHDEELKEVAARYGVKHAHVEMTREISPLQDLKSLWAFYRLCKKEKPLIVHSHTPKAGIVGMLGAKLAGVPIRLHTVAGLPLMEASGNKRKLLNFVERLTYSCATKVYPNSQGLYEFILKERFTSSNKLKVIANGSSNGIDTSHFSPAAIEERSAAQLKDELGISSEDFVFIFVGRLVGDKGINELITAFSKISKSADQQISNSCKLLLVGPLEAKLDPLLPETLNQIENNPDIISVGFQQDVRPYFALADALVFPSYREGFPNVVLQAGAMELPAIVSDINGCNEIIKDGTNGLIVPPKNAGALQRAMADLAGNPTLHQHLRSHARRLITSRYEQQVVWDALLGEYNHLIDEYKKKKGV